MNRVIFKYFFKTVAKEIHFLQICKTIKPAIDLINANIKKTTKFIFNNILNWFFFKVLSNIAQQIYLQQCFQ